jgi:hypothetical protein
MPRYFFVVRSSGMEVDDPVGTTLPDDAAAIAYAERPGTFDPTRDCTTCTNHEASPHASERGRH